MAKSVLFLSLILSLALLINARIPAKLPENSHGSVDVEETLVQVEPNLLLPSEKPPSETLTIRGPIPTDDDSDLLPRNYHALPNEKQQPETLTLRHIPADDDDLLIGNHHVYIRRPFSRRFHHHHEHGDHDFFPAKEAEIEGDFQHVPIRREEFEGGFMDDRHFSMGPVRFHDEEDHHHRHHHHDHPHRFHADRLRGMKHRREKEDDDEEEEVEEKGGFLKRFSKLLNLP